MNNLKYEKLTAALLAAWFTFSITASALQVFRSEARRPPLAILLAVVIPIAGFLLWFSKSKTFRDFALSLNPRTLTILQAWRIGGFVFLVLYTYHILPGALALPAGWGDIAIGATALIVATKLTRPERRNSFIVWQLLGMTDLVVAIAMGALARFVEPHGVTTAPMTVLPLSLIPTFVVPLLLIVHLICIAQALRWPVRGHLDQAIGKHWGAGEGLV